MFSRPKILFLVSLLFVALLNPKFNPYLLFKFLIFYHSYYYNRQFSEQQVYSYQLPVNYTEDVLLILCVTQRQMHNYAACPM